MNRVSQNHKEVFVFESKAYRSWVELLLCILMTIKYLSHDLHLQITRIVKPLKLPKLFPISPVEFGYVGISLIVMNFMKLSKLNKFSFLTA